MVKWKSIDQEGQREELKKDIDYLFNNYPEIEAPEFRQLKRFYELKPNYNENRALKKSIPNKPRKTIFKNRAQTSEPENAVLELIDNIFDNYIENIERKLIDNHLKITLFFYGAGEETGLLLTENSGGISVEKKEAMVILGQKGEKLKEQEMIGTWGEAFLYSVSNLGQSAEIFSYFPNDPPFCMKIQEDFFKSADSPWHVSDLIFKNPTDINIQKGATTIYIGGLCSKYRINRIKIFKELSDLIEKTYWKKVYDLKIKGHGVKFSIEAFGNEPLENKFEPIIFHNIFSFFPLYRPIYLRNYKITNNIGDEYLSVDAYCGINPYTDSKLNGVWMYGNGRLFEDELKSMHIGYGYEKTELPSIISRRTTEMISIFLFFRSPNSDWNYLIPWRSPSKKGFNPESPIQDKLIDLIAILVDRFLLPVKSLKNPRPLSQMFTQEFINRTIDDKYQYIKKLGKDSKNRGFFPPIYEDVDEFDEVFEDLKEKLDPLIYLDDIAQIDEYEFDRKKIKHISTQKRGILKPSYTDFKNEALKEALNGINYVISHKEQEKGSLFEALDLLIQSDHIKNGNELQQIEFEEEETLDGSITKITSEPTKKATPEPTKRVTPEPTKRVTPEPTKRVTPKKNQKDNKTEEKKLKELKVAYKKEKKDLQQKAKSRVDFYSISTRIKKEIVNYYRKELKKSSKTLPGTIIKEMVNKKYIEDIGQE